jgi:hypothetical protein
VSIARLVDGDSIDPGLERGLTPKAMDGTEDLQKDFLREIQGFIAIAQEVDRQLDNHALMLGDQLGEGRFITRCAPLHQRGLRTA